MIVAFPKIPAFFLSSISAVQKTHFAIALLTIHHHSNRSSLPRRKHRQRRNYQRRHTLRLLRLTDQNLQRPVPARWPNYISSHNLIRRIREIRTPGLGLRSAGRTAQLLRDYDGVIENDAEKDVRNTGAPAGDRCSGGLVRLRGEGQKGRAGKGRDVAVGVLNGVLASGGESDILAYGVAAAGLAVVTQAFPEALAD